MGIDAIQFMHGQNVCHFDISLENMLINDVEVIVDGKTGNLTFCKDNIHINLCDFGLAEHFPAQQDNSARYMSKKYCGKANYKSPEVTSQRPFDAKKNDAWTVGISLFMMLIGGNMCSRACIDDKSFVQVMNGDLDKLLIKWKRLHLVDSQLIDLFNRIFKYEHQRMTLQQMKQHPWARSP